MDALLCRSLNQMSLEQLATYLHIAATDIEKLYEELLNDHEFLNQINQQIVKVRPFYQYGICRHTHLDSVDWFAIQRILLYILVRLYRPSVCLETGVFYGGTTCFLLNALRKNGHGKLISIDLPATTISADQRHHLVGNSENIPPELDIGFLIPNLYKERWTLIKGDSLEEIPKIQEPIDFYSHDSEHSYEFIRTEMELVWKKLTPNATLIADDLDWSNGFFSFCIEKKLFPLLITDNGKSGLRMRTGIVRLDHPFRNKKDIVG